MLLLQNLGYAHPNKDGLFDGLNLAVNERQKIALIGNNGVGKSTLLKLIAGLLLPSSGLVHVSSAPYYVPITSRSILGSSMTLPWRRRWR